MKYKLIHRLMESRDSAAEYEQGKSIFDLKCDCCSSKPGSPRDPCHPCGSGWQGSEDQAVNFSSQECQEYHPQEPVLCRPSHDLNRESDKNYLNWITQSGLSVLIMVARPDGAGAGGQQADAGQGGGGAVCLEDRFSSESLETSCWLSMSVRCSSTQRAYKNQTTMMMTRENSKNKDVGSFPIL